MNGYLYVTVGSHLAIYQLDSSSGDLSPKHKVELGKSGYAIATAVGEDRGDIRMYVGLNEGENHAIGSYRIDSTGVPTLIGHVGVEAMPCHLFPDRGGRFLLAAYYLGGMATVHPIEADGGLGEQVDKQVTETAAHFISTDYSNQFAFVPHVAGANAIYQFLFDAGSGKLTPNPSVPRLACAEGLGPRHLALHPYMDDVIYADNEQGSSVTMYRLDKTSGTLDPIQTVSTLPEGGCEGNSNAQIQIHPKARSLYVTNRGHDSIAMFSIDADTGQLTSLGQQPSVRVPRAIGMESEGNYLYAGGDESEQLITYRIAESGALEQAAAYELGGSANWVSILNLG